MAPASVPPEYSPEHDGPEFVTIVVVAWRGTITGVAGRREEASVARGAYVKHQYIYDQRAFAKVHTI